MLLKDFSEEQKLCGDITDKQTRACAVANMVGIKAALEFFESCGLSADTNNAVHKIKRFLEELNIADVYVGDLRFDIRVSTVEGEFPIPKKHFEFDVTPDLYMLVFYNRTTGEVRVSGFISPVDVDKSDSDENYYYVSKNTITSVSNTADLFDSLVAKAKNTLPLNLKKKILLYLDGSLTDKKEFFAEVVNCAGAREMVLDFVQNQEILKKTNFAFAIADAELEALVEEEIIEEEVKPEASLSEDEIDLGFADGLEIEDSSMIFEDESESSQEPASPEVVELDDFINNVPVEEPVLEDSAEIDVVEDNDFEAEEDLEIVEDEAASTEELIAEADTSEDESENLDETIEVVEDAPIVEMVEDVEVKELATGVEDLEDAEPQMIDVDEIEDVSEVVDELIEEPSVELPDDVEDSIVEDEESETLELADYSEEDVEEIVEESKVLSLDIEEDDVVEEVPEPIEESLEFEADEDDAIEPQVDSQEILEEETLDEIDEEVELELTPIETLEEIEEPIVGEIEDSEEDDLVLEPLEDAEIDDEIDGIELENVEEPISGELDEVIEEPLELESEEDAETLSFEEAPIGDYEELEPSILEEEEVSEQIVDEEDFVVENVVEPEPSIDIKATMEGFVNSLEPEEGMSLKAFEEEITPLEEVVEESIEEQPLKIVEEPEPEAQGEIIDEVQDDSVLEEVAIQDDSVEAAEPVVEEAPQAENSPTETVENVENVAQEEIEELYQGPVEEPEFETTNSYRKAKKSSSGAVAAVLVLALAAAGAAGYFYKDMIMEKFFAGSQQESIPNELATPVEAPVAPPIKVQKKKVQTEAQEMLNDIEEPVQLLDSSVSVSALTVDCDVPSVMVNNHSRRYLIKLAKRMQLQLRNALLIAGEQPLANKIVIDLVVDKDVIKYDRISSSSGSKKVDSIVSVTSESVLKDTQPYAGTFGKNSGVVRLVVKF